MTTVHKFGAIPISCHAWSGSKTELALSHNFKDVTLYSAKVQGWEKTSVLDQHDLGSQVLIGLQRPTELSPARVTGTPTFGFKELMANGSTRWCCCKSIEQQLVSDGVQRKINLL